MKKEEGRKNGKKGRTAAAVNPGEMPGGQGRMANLELLRCVAMLMVVALHYLGKGNLLADLTGEMNLPRMTAWLLESFCIVAVNVYMFISGYFLCMSSFKPSRLLGLLGQVWFYSVVFGLTGAVFGVMRGTDFDIHYLLTLLFPVSMGHYWFMTAYVFFYLLLPLAGTAVKGMSREQMQVVLGAVLFTFCVLKSIFPVRFEMDGQGYDCLWYLCVFLAAAYVRRFGSVFLERWGLALYLGCCVLIFAGTFALRGIYLKTGSLGTMMKMCMEYNHLLPFLASAGLFGAFRRIKIRESAAKWINRTASCTLGVYLLHENIGLRYAWQEWFGAGRAVGAMETGSAAGAVSVLFWTGIGTAGVFACGILTEAARRYGACLLGRLCGRFGIFRRLRAGIAGLDRLFAGGNREAVPGK